MKRTIFYRALIVCWILAIGIVGGAPALACEKSLIISNESELTLVGLWISPPGGFKSADNVLSNDQIDRRMQTVIDMSTYVKPGIAYDVSVVWVDVNGNL